MKTERKGISDPVADRKAAGRKVRKLCLEKCIKIDDIVPCMGLTVLQAGYKWQRRDWLPSADNLYGLSKLSDTPVEEILVTVSQES